MKNTLLILLFVFANLAAHAQCSSVGVQISSSDTSYIQLYNAAFFLIPSGIDNVCEWTVTTFDGELIHKDSTFGEFNDQSRSYFDHSVSIADSMKATIVITNDTEGIICTINDTLYWEEIEVLPGAIIGNWSVLSDNGGVEVVISNASEYILNSSDIELFPSPTYDYFSIKSERDFHSITILDVNGQIIAQNINVLSNEMIDISQYATGVYFVQFWNKNSQSISTKKIVKI